MPGFFREVSMLLINIWKKDQQKIGPGFLRFVSMLLLNIWKKDQQKIGPGFFWDL